MNDVAAIVNSRAGRRVLAVIGLLLVVHFVFLRQWNHAAVYVEEDAGLTGQLHGVDTKPNAQVAPGTGTGTGTGIGAKNPLTGAQTTYRRENATLVTLARNSDLDDLIETIRAVEDRFNRDYHYDWVFLNNDEFSDEFKRVTTNLISGTTKYGLIPTEHWSYPPFIDQEKARKGREQMASEGIIYGGSESYRHMCRYESGFFFQHPLMQDYRYYWRVEPSTKLSCSIDYDVFKFMHDNNKTYGFVITLYEYQRTIETLWPLTKEFVKKNPQYIAPNNLLDFMSHDNMETYNLCHFWSNFEIADADFWRGEAYQAYFNTLDQAGGFFYERWGDAPVHSIAAGLFLDRDQIHLFDDVGYTHPPYTHCPANFIDRGLSCTCKEKDSFDWDGYSCMKQYYRSRGWAIPS